MSKEYFNASSTSCTSDASLAFTICFLVLVTFRLRLPTSFLLTFFFFSRTSTSFSRAFTSFSFTSTALSNFYGASLGVTIAENMMKLDGREARGTIKGSGDER